MSVHVVIPDPHAHYKHHNQRAEWAGKLIADVKPDVVVVLGDTADMPSLSGYDKGKKSFQGRTYKADIDSHGDFQERLWNAVRKSKRKLPRRVTLIGNHEQRIDRAIEVQPELEGTVSYKDLDLGRWYSDIIHYTGNTPGTISIDGVWYAHYFVSGVMGRPIGGEHPAFSLISKGFTSGTQGHTHIYDHSIRTGSDGRKIVGLVAGCFVDYETEWAGQSKDLWWNGLFIKRGVADGAYDLEAVSMERLKQEYGRG